MRTLEPAATKEEAQVDVPAEMAVGMGEKCVEAF